MANKVDLAVQATLDKISGKTSTPTKKLNKVDSAVQDVLSKLGNLPVTPPTLGEKVIGVGKELVKGAVEPVLTMAARPIQLAAELLGASDEQVNEFTKTHFGDWIAPTPQNAGDVYKDVGRGIQTALTAGFGATAKSALGLASSKGITPALKLLAKEGALEGAGFGLGASMEQGNDIVSKNTLKNVALGAGIGAITPVALRGASKLLKGKGTKVASEVAEEVTTPIDTTSTTIPPSSVIPETPKVTPDADGFIPYQPPKQKELINDSVKYLNEQIKINPDLPVEEQIKFREFASQKNLKQIEVVNSHDLAYQLKVLKQEIVPTDAPIDAYIANIKMIAQKLSDNGDDSLAIELSKNRKYVKAPGSFAAQDLQAINIASKDNITDMLIDTIEKKEAKLPKNIIKNKETIINNIKKQMSDVVDKLRNDSSFRKKVREFLIDNKC